MEHSVKSYRVQNPILNQSFAEDGHNSLPFMENSMAAKSSYTI